VNLLGKPRSVESSARVARNVAAIFLCLAMLGCGPRELTPAQRGEVVYRTNCASCHNRNPNLPGWLGPALAGSSHALIEDRVLHLTYPPGYVPKQNTHKMRALPWLNGHVDDLTAYLDQAATDQK
jgi:mono/diheme cytochrome c family protein